MSLPTQLNSYSHEQRLSSDRGSLCVSDEVDLQFHSHRDSKIKRKERVPLSTERGFNPALLVCGEVTTSRNLALSAKDIPNPFRSSTAVVDVTTSHADHLPGWSTPKKASEVRAAIRPAFCTLHVAEPSPPAPLVLALEPTPSSPTSVQSDDTSISSSTLYEDFMSSFQLDGRCDSPFYGDWPHEPLPIPDSCELEIVRDLEPLVSSCGPCITAEVAVADEIIVSHKLAGFDLSPEQLDLLKKIGFSQDVIVVILNFIVNVPSSTSFTSHFLHAFSTINSRIWDRLLALAKETIEPQHRLFVDNILATFLALVTLSLSDGSKAEPLMLSLDEIRSFLGFDEHTEALVATYQRMAKSEAHAEDFKNLRAAPSAFSTIESSMRFSSAILATVSLLKLVYSFLEEYLNPVFSQVTQQLQRFQQQSEDLDKNFIPSVQQLSDMRSEVQVFQNWLLASKTRLTPVEAKIFTDWQARLASWKTVLDSGAQRPRPFSVWLAGSTGVGKSTYASMFAKGLCKSLGHDITDADILYVRADFIKNHADGFANQKVFILDDFFTNGVVDDDQYNFYLSLINNSACPLRMADLPSKGTAFAAPILVITLSNLITPPMQMYPAAFASRRDVLAWVSRPEKTHTVLFDKYRFRFCQNPHLTLEEVSQVQWSVELGYHQFNSQCALLAKDHFTAQEAFMKDSGTSGRLHEGFADTFNGEGTDNDSDPDFVLPPSAVPAKRSKDREVVPGGVPQRAVDGSYRHNSSRVPRSTNPRVPHVSYSTTHIAGVHSLAPTVAPQQPTLLDGRALVPTPPTTPHPSEMVSSSSNHSGASSTRPQSEGMTSVSASDQANQGAVTSAETQVEGKVETLALTECTSASGLTTRGRLWLMAARRSYSQAKIRTFNHKPDRFSYPPDFLTLEGVQVHTFAAPDSIYAFIRDVVIQQECAELKARVTLAINHIMTQGSSEWLFESTPLHKCLYLMDSSLFSVLSETVDLSGETFCETRHTPLVLAGLIKLVRYTDVDLEDTHPHLWHATTAAAMRSCVAVFHVIPTSRIPSLLFKVRQSLTAFYLKLRPHLTKILTAAVAVIGLMGWWAFRPRPNEPLSISTTARSKKKAATQQLTPVMSVQPGSVCGDRRVRVTATSPADGKVHSQYGFALSERRFLFTHHFVAMLRTLDCPQLEIVASSFTLELPYSALIDTKVSRYGQTDLAVFDVGRNVVPVKFSTLLRTRFATDSVHREMGHFRGFVLSGAPEFSAQAVDAVSTWSEENTLPQYQSTAGSVTTHYQPTGFRCQMSDLKRGSCGSLLLDQDSQIVGILVAGVLNSGRAYFEQLTREMFCLLTDTSASLLEPLFQGAGVAAILRAVIPDNVLEVLTPSGYQGQSQSDLALNSFDPNLAEVCGVPEKPPVHLTWMRDEDGKLFHPLIESMVATAAKSEEPVHLDTDLWAKLERKYASFLHDLGFRPRLLEWNEVWNGCPSIGLDPLVIDTSAGNMFLNLKSTRKDSWFQRHLQSDGSYLLVPTQRLSTFVTTIASNIESGRWRTYEDLPPEYRVFFTYKAALKDEKRKANKRARLFCISSLVEVALLRRYHGSLLAFSKTHSLDSMLGVGLNPVSSEWTRLASMLGDTAMALDAVGFDSSSPREGKIAIHAVTMCYPDISDGFRNALSFFSNVHASTRVTVGGTLFLFRRFMPSGVYPTILFNGIRQVLTIAYVLIKLGLATVDNVFDYMRKHGFCTMGDDVIGSGKLVPPELLSKFRDIALFEAGTEFTPASKKSKDPADFIDDTSRVDFIKRSFAWTEDRCLCPLDLTSLANIMTARNKDDTEQTHFYAVYRVVMGEASLYPPGQYDTIFAHMQACAKYLGVTMHNIPSSCLEMRARVYADPSILSIPYVDSKPLVEPLSEVVENLFTGNPPEETAVVTDVPPPPAFFPVPGLQRVDPSRLALFAKLGSHVWSGALTTTYTFPDALLNVPSNTYPLNLSLLMCSDVEIMLQVSSSSTSSGLAVAAIIPYGPMYGSELNKFYNNPTRITSFDHVEVALGSSGTYKLIIPHDGSYSQYPLQGGSSADLAAYRKAISHSLVIKSLTIVDNADVSGSVVIDVYARFINSETIAPGPGVVVPLMNSHHVARAQKLHKQYKQSTNRHGDGCQCESCVGPAPLGPEPEDDGILDMIGDVAGSLPAIMPFAAKALTAFGFSQPPEPTPSTYLASTVDEPSTAVSTAAGWANAVEVVASGVDGLSIEHLASKRVIMDQLYWSSALPQGSVLLNTIVSPLLQAVWDPTAGTHLFDLHPAGVVAALFDFYRYDYVDVTLRVVAPTLTAGKLVIGYFPLGPSSSLTAVAGTTTAAVSAILDLAESKVLTVRLPFTAFTPVLRTALVPPDTVYVAQDRNHSPGSLRVEVQQPLIASTPTPSPCVVFVSYSFHGMSCSGRSSDTIEILEPLMGIELQQDDKVAAPAVVGTTPIGNHRVTGETISSLKLLLLTPHHFSITASVTNPGKTFSTATRGVTTQRRIGIVGPQIETDSNCNVMSIPFIWRWLHAMFATHSGSLVYGLLDIPGLGIANTTTSTSIPSQIVNQRRFAMPVRLSDTRGVSWETILDDGSTPETIFPAITLASDFGSIQRISTTTQSIVARSPYSDQRLVVFDMPDGCGVDIGVVDTPDQQCGVDFRLVETNNLYVAAATTIYAWVTPMLAFIHGGDDYVLQSYRPLVGLSADPAVVAVRLAYARRAPYS